MPSDTGLSYILEGIVYQILKLSKMRQFRDLKITFINILEAIQLQPTLPMFYQFGMSSVFVH